MNDVHVVLRKSISRVVDLRIIYTIFTGKGLWAMILFFILDIRFFKNMKSINRVLQYIL